MADDVAGHGLRANGADEALVNFEAVQFELCQVRQAGVARAEIVNGHHVPLRSQRSDRLAGLPHVQEHALRCLDVKTAGVHAHLRARSAQSIRQRRVAEVLR
ncbi:hypothetical protein D3C71_1581980 [compost metagenome]